VEAVEHAAEADDDAVFTLLLAHGWAAMTVAENDDGGGGVSAVAVAAAAATGPLLASLSALGRTVAMRQSARHERATRASSVPRSRPNTPGAAHPTDDTTAEATRPSRISTGSVDGIMGMQPVDEGSGGGGGGGSLGDGAVMVYDKVVAKKPKSAKSVMKAVEVTTADGAALVRLGECAWRLPAAVRRGVMQRCFRSFSRAELHAMTEAVAPFSPPGAAGVLATAAAASMPAAALRRALCELTEDRSGGGGGGGGGRAYHAHALLTACVTQLSAKSLPRLALLLVHNTSRMGLACDVLDAMLRAGRGSGQPRQLSVQVCPHCTACLHVSIVK
jgi:hypothetical protein